MKAALLNTLAWLTGVSKQVLAFLLPIALEIVTELATSAAPGPERQAVAVARLKRKATAAGVVVVSSSLLNPKNGS